MTLPQLFKGRKNTEIEDPACIMILKPNTVMNYYTTVFFI